MEILIYNWVLRSVFKKSTTLFHKFTILLVDSIVDKNDIVLVAYTFRQLKNIKIQLDFPNG